MKKVSLAAAPVASMLAILATLAAVRPVSHGVPVHFGSLQRCPPAVLIDPAVVAHIDSEQDLRLGRQRIHVRDLERELRRIFLTRAERWFFVRAEAEAPMQAVLRVMDAAFKYEVNVVWLPRHEPSPFACLAISNTDPGGVDPWYHQPGPPPRRPTIHLSEVPWWPDWPI